MELSINISKELSDKLYVKIQEKIIRDYLIEKVDNTSDVTLVMLEIENNAKVISNEKEDGINKIKAEVNVKFEYEVKGINKYSNNYKVLFEYAEYIECKEYEEDFVIIINIEEL